MQDRQLGCYAGSNPTDLGSSHQLSQARLKSSQGTMGCIGDSSVTSVSSQMLSFK